MRSDNKVRQLATVCLLWQQWTENSVWFDDGGISAFYSCVVFYLWQSLSEWHLLLSECVLVCHCKNVGTNINFLLKLGKSGSEIRDVLMQVYRDNAMKKTAIYKWVTCFLREEKVSLTRDQDSQQRAELKKTLQKLIKLCMKIVCWQSGA
jgi:hypothetical protein